MKKEERGAGQITYERYTDNHPTIHSNRFLSWSELTDAEREQWNERASLASSKEDEVVLSQPCAETGPNSPSSPEAQSLLGCPFCGNTDLHAFEHHEGHESFGFQCGRCWMTSSQHGSKADAIAAWNRRTPPATPAEAHVEEKASQSQPSGRGADALSAGLGAEPSAVKRTMTITLTDAEMVAMEECMRVAALTQRTVFRQALGGYQVKVREAVNGPIRDDRMPAIAEAHVEGGGETFRTTDFAWLIEAPGQRYLAVRQLSSNPPDFFWTTEASKALRFFSREQADLTAGGVRYLNPDLWGFAFTLGEAWPREHGWLAASTASPAERPALPRDAAKADAILSALAVGGISSNASPSPLDATRHSSDETPAPSGPVKP